RERPQAPPARNPPILAPARRGPGVRPRAFLGRRLAQSPRSLGRRRAQIGVGHRSAGTLRAPSSRGAEVSRDVGYSRAGMRAAGIFAGLGLVAFASVAGGQVAPRLLAPGTVSTGDIEFSPALTPDGKTLYFSKGSPGMKRAVFIVVSR